MHACFAIMDTASLRPSTQASLPEGAQQEGSCVGHPALQLSASSSPPDALQCSTCMACRRGTTLVGAALPAQNLGEGATSQCRAAAGMTRMLAA